MAACRAASLAAEELNYTLLKEEQIMVIQEFFNGNDVFVILPTGLGKLSAMLASQRHMTFYMKSQLLIGLCYWS